MLRYQSKRLFSSINNILYKESIISKLDLLGDSPLASNNIDSILSNGSIQFTNGIIIESNKSILLLSGQILELEINYNDKIINRNEIDIRGLNFLKLINPLPDLLVIGTGKYFRKISMNNINFLQIELGLKLEISNSINAIKNFDLLSKERFNGSIMGLILPLNEGGFNK